MAIASKSDRLPESELGNLSQPCRTRFDEGYAATHNIYGVMV